MHNHSIPWLWINRELCYVVRAVFGPTADNAPGLPRISQPFLPALFVKHRFAITS
jgi:hypothetical protein